MAARPQPLRNIVRRRLREAAIERGADPAKVDQVLAEIESERPILDWLKNGGFEALLKFIMELIALLG